MESSVHFAAKNTKESKGADAVTSRMFICKAEEHVKETSVPGTYIADSPDTYMGTIVPCCISDVEVKKYNMALTTLVGRDLGSDLTACITSEVTVLKGTIHINPGLGTSTGYIAVAKVTEGAKVVSLTITFIGIGTYCCTAHTEPKDGHEPDKAIVVTKVDLHPANDEIYAKPALSADVSSDTGYGANSICKGALGKM